MPPALEVEAFGRREVGKDEVWFWAGCSEIIVTARWLKLRQEARVLMQGVKQPLNYKQSLYFTVISFLAPLIGDGRNNIQCHREEISCPLVIKPGNITRPYT